MKMVFKKKVIPIPEPPIPEDNNDEVELEEDPLVDESVDDIESALVDKSVEDIESEIKEEENIDQPAPRNIMYLSESEMLREIYIGVQNNSALLLKVLKLAKG